LIQLINLYPNYKILKVFFEIHFNIYCQLAI
jgi:hypothetical protein